MSPRWVSVWKTERRVLNPFIALQGADPSSPMSIVSLALGKRGCAHPHAYKITSTTLNMSLFKPPQPNPGYPCRRKIHGERESNSDKGHSRGETRGHSVSGLQTTVHWIVWGSVLPKVIRVAESQAWIATDIDCPREPTGRPVTCTPRDQNWTTSN